MTTITITLEMDDKPEDITAQDIYKYIQDLIEDESLGYEIEGKLQQK